MSEKRGEQKQSADSFENGSKKLLGDSIQRKIAYYLTKSKILDSDLYSVVKDFFTELLNIKQEVTCKELKEELNKIYMDNITREKLDRFLDRVSLIEYKDDPYSDEDLRRLLHEFEYLVDAIIKASKRGEKKGFFATLFGGSSKKENKQEEIVNRGTDEILKSLEKTDQELNKKVKQKEKKEEEPPIPLPENKEEPQDEKTKKVLEQLENLNTSDILPKDADFESWTDTVELKKKDENQVKDEWADEKKLKKTKEEPPKEEKKHKSKDKKTLEEDIDTLIKNAKKLKDKQKLKEEYKKINKMYEALSDDEKEQHFEDVHEIYEKIQLAK